MRAVGKVLPWEDAQTKSLAWLGPWCVGSGDHIYGIAGVGTGGTITGDVTRFATAGHFAAFNGTAPLEASSGDVKRHRLSRRGNRQLNKVLYTAAKTQIRSDTPGRT